MSDRDCYAAVTDELNDGTEILGLPPMTLDDLDRDWVRAAQRFANDHDLSWPPQVGDFDRLYDAEHNGGLR